MKKRIITKALMVALAVSLLSGCGNKTEEPSEENIVESVAESSTVEESKESIELDTPPIPLDKVVTEKMLKDYIIDSFLALYKTETFNFSYNTGEALILGTGCNDEYYWFGTEEFGKMYFDMDGNIYIKNATGEWFKASNKGGSVFFMEDKEEMYNLARSTSDQLNESISTYKFYVGEDEEYNSEKCYVLIGKIQGEDITKMYVNQRTKKLEYISTIGESYEFGSFVTPEGITEATEISSKDLQNMIINKENQ